MNQQIKLIATATNLNHGGLKELERSLNIFGWNYEIINGVYQAFGSKMVNAYEYAKATSCSHLFIVDAYDVFMLGNMEQALEGIEELYGNLDCIVFNAEKACWPYSNWAKDYPETDSPWKYLNGGAAFVKTDLFIKMFEENPIKHTDNDQVNLARIYLDKRDQYNMKLDTDCKVFQSIAFEHEDDFELLDSNVNFINLVNMTTPIIIHANGRTSLNEIYKLL